MHLIFKVLVFSILIQLTFCISKTIISNNVSKSCEKNDFPLFESSLDRPEDSQVFVFYKLVTQVLNLIQPNTLTGLNNRINITALITGTTVIDTYEIKNILLHIIGPLICVTIGLLIIVSLILTFILKCVCCCVRNCLCCCFCNKAENEKQRRDGRWSSCRRVLLSAIFFIIVTLLTITLVSTTFSVFNLDRQLNGGEAMGNVQNSLKSIEKFKDIGFVEARGIKDEMMINIDSGTKHQINQLGIFFQKFIDNKTNASNSLNVLINITQTFNKSSKIGQMLSDSLENIKKDQNILEAELFKIRTSIASKIGSCPELCSNLSINANYSTVNSEIINNYVWFLQIAIQNKLPDTSLVARDIYFNITTKINKTFSTQSNEVLLQLQNVSATVNKSFDNLQKELAKLNFKEVIQSLNTTRPYILQIGSGITLFLLTLLGSITFFLLLYVLALVCGVFGKRKGSKSCLNKGRARVILISLSYITLVLLIVVALLAVIIMPVGLIYTEFCRYVINPKQYPKDVTTLYSITQDTAESVSAEVAKISIRKAVEACENNTALYSALQVEQIDPQLNITDLMNLDKYNVSQMIDKLLLNISYDFGDVALFSNHTFIGLHQLEELYNETVIKVIQPLEKLTSSKFTKISLNFASKELGKNITFLNESSNLKSLHDSTILRMRNHSNLLKHLSSEIRMPSNAVNLVPRLKAIQNYINGDASNDVKNRLSKTSRNVYGLLSDSARSTVKRVHQDLAKCRKLYNAAMLPLSVVCVSLLYPLQTIGAMLAAYVLLMLSLLITASCLAGLYKKRFSRLYVDPIEVEYTMSEMRSSQIKKGLQSGKTALHRKSN